MRVLFLDYLEVQSSGFKVWHCLCYACWETFHGNSKVICSLIFPEMLIYAHSAKRMYYPQSYHHIQEIQKYNIQDYRPRYIQVSIPFLQVTFLTTRITEWSNSRRPFARFDKFNVCANSVVMPSLRRMNRKPEYCRHMIRRRREEGTERWQVLKGIVDEVFPGCQHRS